MSIESKYMPIKFSAITVIFLSVQGLLGKCNHIEALLANEHCEFVPVRTLG